MSSTYEGIAIVGMAGRFPGANNISEYWQNLIEGKDCIKFFADEELAKYEHHFNQLKNDPSYVKARGVLDNVDMWDAKFFGYAPFEAANTDPQQRLWLETAWHALEDAACDPFTYKGPIGVFGGSYLNSYLLNNVLRDPVKYENYIRSRGSENFQTYLASDPTFLATRTSYLFNLKGPSVFVSTACSTSLVAVSQACNSLSSFESDVCLAGGVCIINPQETGYLYQEGAIASNDGHCRPFDKASKGTIFSNGVGVVVLKRLEDAVKDNNTIYAVIKGWAINNDGNQKVGYTAPSISGQAEAISMAQSLANVNPADISYIEAHGTATPMGDPIEIAGLTKAFKSKTTQTQYCGIGSVKSNIGHLDAAAGIASLIKVALSAYNKKIPATIHYKEPNPAIDFKNSPFYVVDKTLEWTANKPLIMGVSSFGVGGTNAHVIVENFEPETTQSLPNNEPKLIVLSAKSENSIKALKENISTFINNNSVKASEIAYTLQRGRSHMNLRACAVFDGNKQLQVSDLTDAIYSAATKQVVFLFPGQGAQYIGMGKQLYASDAQFRIFADECFAIFNSIVSFDLKSLLFGDATDDNEHVLAQTQYTQPALFIIEYAMAKLYMHYGIQPAYFLGHSIGEYAAACISGVFNLKAALSVVIKRGQLMQAMPGGTMLAVKTSAQKLKDLQSNLFEIAAINSPSMCTVSLTPNNLEGLKQLFDKQGIGYTLLNTSHAFHSSDFDSILAEFEQYVNSFTLNNPQIPFISCLTGSLITNLQATTGSYWASQLRNTVQFSVGVSTLATNPETIFFEVGPNTHLSGLVRQNDDVQNKSYIIASLAKADAVNEQTKFYKSLGNLWMKGVEVTFEKLYTSIPKYTNLPPYPFDRKRYWIDYVPSNNDTSQHVNMKNSTSDKKDGAEVESSQSQTTHFKVKALLSELSGYQMQEINDDQNFSDFGFDSLFLARYASALSDKFKFNIEFRKLVFEFPSVTQLAIYIEGNLSNSTKEKSDVKPNLPKGNNLNNFTPFTTDGNLEALTLVHGDDLNIHIPRLLGKTRPFYGFLHPSADGDRLEYNNVQEMATHYMQQILAFKPKGPYLLGGFSYGGLLAYEIALQLERLGHDVPYLFLMDCGTPEARIRHDDQNAKEGVTKVPSALKSVFYFFNKYYYKFYYRSIRLFRDMYFLTHKKLPIEQRRAYVYDVYTNLSRKYRPSGKYKGKAIVFRASENTSDMPYLGWEKYIDSILELITVRGDHVTVLKYEDSIALIQEKVAFYLNKYETEKQK